MSASELRALAWAHEIAAWLATAALAAAPWIASRARARRWIGIAVGSGAALSITLAGALGVLLEGAYRARIRQRLFIEAPALGWLFERKEHLAFGAILLGWSGVLSLSAAQRAKGELGEALASDLRRAAKVGCAAAALLALAAAVASTIVGRHASL